MYLKMASAKWQLFHLGFIVSDEHQNPTGDTRVATTAGAPFANMV